MSATSTTTLTHLPPPKPNHAFTKRPSSKIGVFFWRRRMWFESTFVLSMLEPWEKILLLTTFALLFLLVFTGILQYMPHHLVVMRRRAMYYLWGQEGDERILWQWLGLATGEGATDAVRAGLGSLHKEL
ncbi:hypothetical protein GALMADRAFT_255127 [Galerina marginata CBS 339.88]|uniref:Uncharacterized protein n=1 Tax=Galerina marginata (strain CBS 339.88) TaxID=685588 RepID=A0A067SH52_GALM3|nr:hypothetical protein GALMADRAFT_255127 [Galerina marginata CBS 339.88]